MPCTLPLRARPCTRIHRACLAGVLGHLLQAPGVPGITRAVLKRGARHIRGITILGTGVARGAPSSALNVPNAHASHAAFSPVKPAAQPQSSSRTVATSNVVLDSGHAVQDKLPRSGLNVPTAHGSQVGPVNPGAHTHWSAPTEPSLLTWLAGRGTQSSVASST